MNHVVHAFILGFIGSGIGLWFGYFFAWRRLRNSQKYFENWAKSTYGPGALCLEREHSLAALNKQAEEYEDQIADLKNQARDQCELENSVRIGLYDEIAKLKQTVANYAQTLGQKLEKP